MAQIEINCIGQTAIYTNTPEIFSGDVNIDTVKFTFDEVWDGYTEKTAVFYNNPKDTYPVMLDENNVAVIPEAVMADKCKLSIGVFGTNANGDVKTSKILTYNIGKGAISNDLEATTPPEFWTQLLTRQIILETELHEQQDTFESNITQRQATYETESTQRQTDFESNITHQQNTFESNLNKQQDDFEEELSQQQSSFENSINQKQTTFENNITQNQNTFKNEITQQQNTFESNMTNEFNALETTVTNAMDDINNELDTKAVITSGTADLTAGTSELASGVVYAMYE